MELYRGLRLPAAAFATFKKETEAANLHALHIVGWAQVAIGGVLTLGALPGIGLLKMLLPYLFILGAGVICLLLAHFVCPRLPRLALPLYYLHMLALFGVTGAMGSVLDPYTNASNFLLLLLLLPLFATDRPWRIDLAVLASAACFCVASWQCKAAPLFKTDLVNVAMVSGITVAFVTMTVRGRLNDFVQARNEKTQLDEKENLINAIPTGIGVFEVRDGITKQTFVNDGYFRLVGDTRAARTARYGGNFVNSIHPDDRAALGALMHRIICGETDYGSMTCRTQCGNGSYIWLRFSSAVARRDGDFLLVYSTYMSMEEEMRSNAARRQSQTLLEAAMRSANMTAWEYDCDARTVTQGADGIEMHGLTTVVENAPESLIQSDYVHPDSVAELRRLFADFNATKALTQADVRVRKPDGTGYWWEHLTISPLYDPDGNVHRAVGTSLDISDRKEREEQYYRQIGLMTDTGDKNLISKAQYNLTKGRLVLYTPLRADAIRWEPGQTLAVYAASLAESVPAAAERARLLASLSAEALLRRYGDGTPECELVYKRSQPGCPVIYVHNRCLQAVDPQTGDIMLFLYAYDDTQHMVERCVVEQLGTGEYAAIGMIDVDTGAYVLDRVNGTYFAQLPHFGDHYYEICRPIVEKAVLPDEVETMLERVSLPHIRRQLAAASWYEFPYSIREQGGEVRRRKLEFRYLDAEQSALLCTCSDITDLYRQEQERLLQTQKALAEARRATAAKTDFLSRMSHDIRTPLNAILGTAILARDEVDDPAVTREALETIDASGHVLLGLINDILDINKIESGKIELRPEVVLVAEYERMVRTSITPLMEKKHIDFSMQFACGQTALYVDPVRYRQIFFNLLSNAAKYTQEYGRVVYATQAIHAREGMVGVRSTVKDNGIGITAEYQEHLFEAFTRDNNAEINQTEGSGLGLAIVKNIVDAMGGTITVNSAPGQGSEFVVDLYFPVVTPDMLPQGVQPTACAQPAAATLRGRRILLVEDNAINTRIAGKMLERCGCTVETAVNGKQAVDWLVASPPGTVDAVLMDIRMPVMNGIDATKALRAADRADLHTLPIVAMTADAFSEDISRTMAAGMNGHLSKPVDPDKLYSILARVLSE